MELIKQPAEKPDTDFKPRNLADIAQSFARRNMKNTPLFNDLTGKIIELIDAKTSFLLWDISNILRAFVAMDESSPNLFACMLTVINNNAETEYSDKDVKALRLVQNSLADKGIKYPYNPALQKKVDAVNATFKSFI